MAALITFILMMAWSSVAMLFDTEILNSPVAFSLQRYWLLSWNIIALIFSFFVMTMGVIVSVIFSGLKDFEEQSGFDYPCALCKDEITASMTRGG